MDYAELENKIRAWAGSQPGIRAVVVIGSRAREAPGPDEWSDLDLILFASSPDAYAAGDGWLTKIAEVWLASLAYTRWGDPEWMAWFAGGLKADFLFTVVPPGDSLEQMLAALPYKTVFQRGARLLFDLQDPQPGRVLRVETPPREHRPTVEAFQAGIGEFLFEAMRAAKLARRGDTWRAKEACDGELKKRLLTMLEWHARAAHGPDHDTWYGGRHLSGWADPRAVSVLPQTFAQYDPADIQRALRATFELYVRLAAETAGRLGFPYPAEAVDRVRGWLWSITE